MTSATAFTQPKTILLATDLSARCDRALDRAVQLARQWQARLVALSVVDSGTLSANRVRAMPKPSWADRPHDPVQHALDKLRRDAAADDVNIVLRVEEGRTTEVLDRVALEEEAGLIVTGIARNESMGMAILGSSVDWLVRHARVPVLVVRERARAAYRSIVVASDYSPSSALALKTSLNLFPQVDHTLFHAFAASFSSMLDADQNQAIEHSRAEALERAEAFFAGAELDTAQRQKVRLLTEHGEPVRLIYEYVRDHGTDLIALGTHGRSALFDILIGSIAKRILATAATDVLLVRDPRHGK